jgi:hypothetical protein
VIILGSGTCVALGEADPGPGFRVAETRWLQPLARHRPLGAFTGCAIQKIDFAMRSRL